MKLAGIVALAFLALICKFETAQCNLHIFSSRTVLQKRWLSRAASQIWDFYLPTRVDPNSTCGLALQNMAVSLADKSSIWAARSKIFSVWELQISLMLLKEYSNLY
ncbi:uncharacterized protein LOC134788722 [Penaeus indicus]|uniref:uncharacterized protein LOC134788722 n=1 Tax=Penaeus indicus TaxID=29960 RepID=UPI00300D5E80